MESTKCQCCHCQWTGTEKQTRVRNRDDEQIKERCPQCGTYGSIIEARNHRFTLTVQMNVWASNKKEAEILSSDFIKSIIKSEDNNAKQISLTEDR